MIISIYPVTFGSEHCRTSSKSALQIVLAFILNSFSIFPPSSTAIHEEQLTFKQGDTEALKSIMENVALGTTNYSNHRP